jgi:UDP-glucuronate decarboxylase
MLSRRLLNGGHQVICLDDLSSGDLNGVLALSEHPGFSFICRDAKEGVSCVPDSVIHMVRLGLGEEKRVVGTSSGMEEFMVSADLAARTGARLLLTRRLETFEASIKKGTMQGGVTQVAESESVIEMERRLIAALQFEFKRKYQLDFHVARIFNLYGLGSSKGLDALLQSAQAGGSIEVLNPEGEHWFCHKDDALNGVMRLALAEFASEAPSRFDFACAEAVKARSVCRMVGSAFGVVVGEETRWRSPQSQGPRLDTAFRWLDWHGVTRFVPGLNASIDLLKRTSPSLFKGECLMT